MDWSIVIFSSWSSFMWPFVNMVSRESGMKSPEAVLWSSRYDTFVGNIEFSFSIFFWFFVFKLIHQLNSIVHWTPVDGSNVTNSHNFHHTIINSTHNIPSVGFILSRNDSTISKLCCYSLISICSIWRTKVSEFDLIFATHVVALIDSQRFRQKSLENEKL